MVAKQTVRVIVARRGVVIPVVPRFRCIRRDGLAARRGGGMGMR